MQQKTMVGVLLVVTAAVAYSTAGLFTKGVAAEAWAVIFWRGLFAIAFSVAWTAHQGTFRREFLGFTRPGWTIAVVGALGTAAFIPAFKLTSIANVSLIYAIAPLIAALLAWIAIGERVTQRTLIGSIVAIVGVGIIVSGSVGQISLAGDLLALSMTAAMASVMVLYRAFPDTPGAGPTAMQSILLLPPAFFLGSPFSVPMAEVVILAAFGLLFAVAAVTLAEGSKRLPASQTALLSALETPLAPILAFVVLSEVPSGAALVGGAVVLAAVLYSIDHTTRH